MLRRHGLTRRRTSIGAAILSALSVSAIAATAQAPALDPYLGIPVGGGPIRISAVPVGLESIESASCGRCHPRQYQQWRDSAHHRSYTNAVFQAEFGERRSPFCANCHAPRGNEEAGIDCAVCHIREGAVLNPTVSGRAPHVSRVAPEVSGTLACARCHQFDFDGQPDEPLQRTVEEWMVSEHRDTSCQGCHMRVSSAGHAHDFPGGLDRELLRDAIAVRATATGEDGMIGLRLELSADGAGHAVPTGDIFRRIEVRAWPAGEPRLAETAELGRRFSIDRQGWHQRDDQRVPAIGSRLVELEMESSATHVAYTIDLWRTAPERARRAGWSERALRRRLASGVVRVAR